jgi:hypothetical protein
LYDIVQICVVTNAREVCFRGRRRREIQNRKQKEIYEIFKIEIIFKKFFRPEYCGAISETGFKRIRCKLISKISGPPSILLGKVLAVLMYGSVIYIFIVSVKLIISKICNSMAATK